MSIYRKAYSYKRKDGKVVHVPRTKIKDVGKKGKTPTSKKVLPVLKKGELSKHGYAANKSDLGRHRALSKAIGNSSDKAHKVIKRLTVIATYTKNTQPGNYKKYKKDAQWVHEKYL